MCLPELLLDQDTNIQLLYLYLYEGAIQHELNQCLTNYIAANQSLHVSSIRFYSLGLDAIVVYDYSTPCPVSNLVSSLLLLEVRHASSWKLNSWDLLVHVANCDVQDKVGSELSLSCRFHFQSEVASHHMCSSECLHHLCVVVLETMVPEDQEEEAELEEQE